MSFPKAHRVQIHSTNPLERLNAEIKRRTDVVGIFPNEPAITRLVGALLLEQNDEWQLQRRYLQLEGLQSLADNQPARLSAVVRRKLRLGSMINPTVKATATSLHIYGKRVRVAHG
jgi:putative transposase